MSRDEHPAPGLSSSYRARGYETLSSPAWPSRPVDHTSDNVLSPAEPGHTPEGEKEIVKKNRPKRGSSVFLSRRCPSVVELYGHTGVRSSPFIFLPPDPRSFVFPSSAARKSTIHSVSRPQRR